MKAIGGGAGDCLCSVTKDPKHVLQDESLFEPCFLKTSNMFRWSLSRCHATTREQLGISLVSSEIQKVYKMMSITRDLSINNKQNMTQYKYRIDYDMSVFT